MVLLMVTKGSLKTQIMKASNTRSKATPNKSRAVVGGISARHKKFRVVLFSVAAILVLTALGLFGYDKYRASTLKAHAANYPVISQEDGFVITACRYSTIYGSAVRVIAKKPTSAPAGSLNVNTQKPEPNAYGDLIPLAHRDSQTWWNGQVTAVDTYAHPQGTFWVLIYVFKRTAAYPKGANIPVANRDKIKVASLPPC